ncbi:MAG: CDP-alcohol phosphatidyltransferase family protein [Planctomycetota bacterium]
MNDAASQLENRRSRPAASGDCYSSSDRAWMERWNTLRRDALAPLLKALREYDVSADHITWASLAFGLAFAPLLLFVSPAWAIAALALHAALDGLDGPLARFRGNASRRGSFTDTFCDQLVVAATTAALAAFGAITPAIGLAYVFLYTLVVVFAMIRNALGVPYRWVLRPRFIVYALLPVELYFATGVLEVVIATLLLPLVLATITGARALRRAL